MIEKSSQISTEIHDILQNTMLTRERLSSNAKQAALAIEKAGQTAIDQIRKLVKAEQDKLNEWISNREKKLTNTEEQLLSQQSQIQRCEEMANQVLKTGSDYDVASIYKQLVSSLRQAGCAQCPVLEPGLDKVVFEPNQVPLGIQSLGNLSFSVRKVSSRHWVLEKEFGQNGRCKLPYGVVVTPSGDIAITNLDSLTPVQIYSKIGSFKQSLGKESTGGWNIIALNGRLFITRNSKKCVASFTSDGKYLSEFPVVSPDGIKSSDRNGTSLRGLAVDHQNKLLLVGELYHKYISIHTCDGSHIRSIRSPISPMYICTTSQGNIIVSDCLHDLNVYVMDMSGKQLAEIKPPQGVAGWKTYGICVSHNDEICIADRKNKSIHCFTQTGQYLGCIAKDLNGPTGIALMDNDTKLIVAECYTNKMKILTATSA